MLERVEIVEVAPRDGLQNAPEQVSTADKLALIARLLDAGLRRIEVASFVHPARVPQMADAEAVIAGLPDIPDAVFIGLVLNLRGVERALATREGGRRGIDEVGCVLVATDSFGQKNQGQSVADGLEANRAMIRAAVQGGLRAGVTISAAFGCPFEGEVPAQRVVELARALAEAGPREVALADTIGVAVPSQVTDLFAQVREALPAEIALRGHFHNTRGTGIANAWAALQAGATALDASLGGLGGCPFAPRATGNVATEDLVYMLSRSGVATGVELDALIAANHWLGERLGRELPSMVGRAGGFAAAA